MFIRVVCSLKSSHNTDFYFLVFYPGCCAILCRQVQLRLYPWLESQSCNRQPDNTL